MGSGPVLPVEYFPLFHRESEPSVGLPLMAADGSAVDLHGDGLLPSLRDVDDDLSALCIVLDYQVAVKPVPYLDLRIFL